MSFNAWSFVYFRNDIITFSKRNIIIIKPANFYKYVRSISTSPSLCLLNKFDVLITHASSNVRNLAVNHFSFLFYYSKNAVKKIKKNYIKYILFTDFRLKSIRSHVNLKENGFNFFKHYSFVYYTILCTFII